MSATTKWELYVFEYARSRSQPVASLIAGAFADGTIDLPFSFVLARSGDRNVLLDCGFMNEGGGAEMALRFDVPWWVSPVSPTTCDACMPPGRKRLYVSVK